MGRGGRLLLLFLVSLLLAGCASGSYFISSPPPLPVGKDCSYHVEPDSLIKVDVYDDKPIYRDPNWYGDKETATFVLIKRNAGIPAWKVWGGYGGGEMEEIGVTVPDVDPDNPDGQGKRVFIGLGHCRGKPGETCLDPLPQSILFVVQTEGAKPPNLPREESSPGYWWFFNVYYDLSAFRGDGTPKDENLPSWIKNCVGGDQRGQGVQTTGALAEEITPPTFINKEAIVPLSPLPPHWEDLEEVYVFTYKVLPYPADVLEKIGTINYRGTTFDVFYTLSPEGFIHLVSQEDTQICFQYEGIAKTVPRGKTLQLGTFHPYKKFIYEWWTPSCKPVIYLYPPKPTLLSVVLQPFGLITKSRPHYPLSSGWRNLLAFPSGKIIYREKEYPSLYYEGWIVNVKVPTQGWVVRREDLFSFFEKILPRLGLREKEIFEFQDYWLGRLKKDLYFITFLSQEEINRIEPMEIVPQPETTIRVRLFFKALEKPIVTFPPPLPEIPKREGFTVVDWGGFVKE